MAIVGTILVGLTYMMQDQRSTDSEVDDMWAFGYVGHVTRTV